MPGFDPARTPILLDVAPLILEESKAMPTVPAYVSSLGIQYAYQKVSGLLRGFSDKVEPIDPALGVDPKRPYSRNFCSGIFLGSKVIEHALGPEFLSAQFVVMCDADYGGGEIEDERAKHHEEANNILDYGRIGLASEDPNIRLVREWEDIICPDITLQSYFSNGFGFMIAVSHEILRCYAAQEHAADLEVMRNQLEHGEEYDWSAGLQELGTIDS